MLFLLDGEAPRTLDDASGQLRAVLKESIVAWQEERPADDQIRLLNWMLSSEFLEILAETDKPGLKRLTGLLRAYRELEQKLAEPVTVNGMEQIISLWIIV